MITSAKRVLPPALVATVACVGLTLGSAPADAAYSSTAVANRTMAHHGGIVKVKVSHFAKNTPGTVTAIGHGAPQGREVITHFRTNHNGFRNVSVKIPRNLTNGRYVFRVTVKRTSASFDFRVI